MGWEEEGGGEELEEKMTGGVMLWTGGRRSWAIEQCLNGVGGWGVAAVGYLGRSSCRCLRGWTDLELRESFEMAS